MTATSPAELASLLRREPRRTRTPGQLLYGLYLVLLFGGLYGGLLVHAIITVPTPPATSEQLRWLGALAVALPPAAALAGVRFGRWAGPVPVTGPEAALLLPTPLDRRRLLLPRYLWSLGVAVLAGSVLALATVVLVALALSVGPAAWWLLPAFGALLGSLAAGSAGITQSWPAAARRHTAVAVVLVVLASAPVLTAVSTALPRLPSGGLSEAVGAGLLGVNDLTARSAPVSTSDTSAVATIADLPATSVVAGIESHSATSAVATFLGALAVAAVALAVLAGATVWRTHDEELTARAGIHGGAAASLRLGDLRAVTQLAAARVRQRALPRPPLPRRSTGAIAWRNLVALQAHPWPLLRATVGWVLATWLLGATPPQASLTGIVFRVVAASGVLVVALAPLLEPLRREHDAPLASELLPFGFATLARLHLRTAIVLATLTGMVGVLLASLLLDGVLPGWALLFVPLGAATAVITVADRVRQPENLAEVVAAMPMGATPEVLGVALAARVATPLLGMLPLALPLVAAAAATVLPVPGVVVLTVGGLGVVLLLFRVGGLLLWLSEFERSLLDAEVLEPSSTIPIAWRRLRAWVAQAR